ncbi:DUF5677 domain-containing protein [Nocardia nova]|uniref:DUF5677 domain-containing protein n=1 Tax=Nocardia nova TaxID=37330 RepID=UPI00189364A3|nr:DUF5677 domain-containing protein [Nocardia nova]MBF6278054.1 hypothetical protein [Nocardia nova]
MLAETALEYLDISRGLIKSFDEQFDRESFRIKTRGRDAHVKAATVLGLAVHVHKLGAVALDLLEREVPVLLVIPTLRACFETALTAHWTAQSTDATAAMYNKEGNQRRAAQKTLAAAQSSTMQDLAARVAHTDLPKLATSSDQQAKYFEQLLADFDADGTDAYAYYRILSTFSHPSATLVDQYLEEDPDPEVPFTLLTEPTDTLTPGACMNLVGCCLVWAGSAARYVQQDTKARRFELRDAANALGTIADIQLNPKALLRQPRKR